MEGEEGRGRAGGPLNGTIGVFRVEIRKQSTMDGIERRGKANRGCWYRTNDNKWHDATPKTVPIYSPEAVSVDNVTLSSSSPPPLSSVPFAAILRDKISKIHRPPPEKSTLTRLILPRGCATTETSPSYEANGTQGLSRPSIGHPPSSRYSFESHSQGRESDIGYGCNETIPAAWISARRGWPVEILTIE